MGSDDPDSAVYAPFDAIKRHYGYLHRIKDIREALQLAPKVNTIDHPSRTRDAIARMSVNAQKVG